jgi:hypothetical protein
MPSLSGNMAAVLPESQFVSYGQFQQGLQALLSLPHEIFAEICKGLDPASLVKFGMVRIPNFHHQTDL